MTATAAVDTRDRLFIDDQWVESLGSGTIEVVNPAAEQVIGSVPQDTAADVDPRVHPRTANPGTEPHDVYDKEVEVWPLQGRRAELERLTEVLDDPSARGLLLCGPQGAGKSRLGAECLRLARERGMATQRIWATHAASTLPLGAVFLDRPPQESGDASPADQTELVHRVASELARRADGKRLVLLVDDVQWLDQMSSVLLHQMVVTGTAFVVFTIRTGTTAPESITALWKDNLVDRIAVNPVGREVVESLLENVLRGPVAGAAVADLADRSDGNLLYLREAVLASVEDGSLYRGAGVWQFKRAERAQPRLVDLVGSHLGGLPPDQHECLEIMAFAEPLELPDLVSLVGESQVEHLESKGLIVVRPDGWGGAKVLLAHPLFGEVIRAKTTVMRARQITKTLAVAAEERGTGRADDLLRIATWRLVCGGGDPDLMLRAATAAYARHDHALTRRLAKGAIAVGAGFEAHVLLAEAGVFTGSGQRTEHDLALLASEISGAEQQAAVAGARMVNAHITANQALGLEVYREAMCSIEDPRWRAELTAKRAWLVLMHEGPREGLRAISTGSTESLTGSALVATALAKTCALARTGQVSKALASAELGLRTQQALTEPFELHQASHDFHACEALATAGRLPESHARAQACYDDAIKEHSTTSQLYFSYQLAKIGLAQGRVGRAARLAGEAVGLAHQVRDPHFLAGSLATLAEARACRGDVEGADRALAALDSARQVSWMFSEPSVARAWVAVARGDLVTARRTLEDAVARTLAVDDLRAASLALHSLVRIGDASRAVDRLHELTQRVEGELVPLQARHASACVARDGEELANIAVEFEGLSAMLLAAEAATDSSVAFRAAGEVKRATFQVQRANDLLAECEGARTPGVGELSTRPALTQAERRTALLAANGRTNRAIAAVEQVSVRTVESRLQDVYTKLGISSRRDLAQLLRPKTKALSNA